MALKSLLLAASCAEDDAAVFNAAAALARRFSAHVDVIPAFSDPAADYVSYGAAMRGASARTLERVREAETNEMALLQRLAKEAAQRQGLAIGGGAEIAVHERALQPAAAMAQASVLADLVLFGAASARKGAALGALFAETLLMTRAPALLVGAAAPAFERLAIAWDGSAQAGRAVRAALPLLLAAKHVAVLTNVDEAAASEQSASVAPLQEHLQRHGVASVEAKPVRGGNVAASLIEGARAAQCDTLVVGAYGRPRLYELVLGGTTRALVHAADAPHLLMAH